MGRRAIATEVTMEDEYIETILQSQCPRGYVEQEKIKSTLSICIETAETRGGSLDHVLLCGPSGLSKITLAGTIANEIGTNMRAVSGPAIEKSGEMAAILDNLQEGGVLFVGGIRRLNHQVGGVLCPTIEDLIIDIMLGKDSTVRSIRLDLPHFTLVGATTRIRPLTVSSRGRFEVVQRLEFYTPEELEITTLHSARVLGVEAKAGGAIKLAGRSRRAPGLANRLLKRVRDFVQVKYDGVITREITDFALDIMDVDKLRLDQGDRNILLMIIEKFSSGPMGLDILVAALGENSGALGEVCESYSLVNGLINRTSRGRTATETAYHRLGLEM